MGDMLGRGKWAWPGSVPKCPELQTVAIPQLRGCIIPLGARVASMWRGETGQRGSVLTDHALPASWPLPIISHHYLRMILSPQSASRQGMELLPKKGVGCSWLIGPLAPHPPTLGWPESTTNTSCHFLSRPGLCKPSLPPCPSEAHPKAQERDLGGGSS